MSKLGHCAGLCARAKSVPWRGNVDALVRAPTDRFFAAAPGSVLITGVKPADVGMVAVPGIVVVDVIVVDDVLVEVSAVMVSVSGTTNIVWKTSCTRADGSVETGHPESALQCFYLQARSSDSRLLVYRTIRRRVIAPPYHIVLTWTNRSAYLRW